MSAIKPTAPAQPSLNLLAINMTQRCNLACAHCYLDAKILRQADKQELQTLEVCQLLDDVAAHHPEAMIVLTGGEPLMRKDLEAIIAHGQQLGLFMLIGTNGMLLTRKRVASLKAAGLQGAGISLDSLDPTIHDRFRGLSGSWQKTMNGIEQCRQQGLSFQLHFTIHKDNQQELEDMIAFACVLEARVINIFFLVCTGRGETMTDLSPAQYEAALLVILKAQQQYPNMIIRPRCAPHSKRVAHQLDASATNNQISGMDGDGCIAGRHYCRVTPRGEVTACPYIDASVGNIRDQKLTQIWQQAEAFQQLRQPVLTGKCGACEYRQLCGGCRARPVAQGHSLMDSDSLCQYEPDNTPVILPIINNTGAIEWSAAATERLSRAPGFVRKMIKQRVELEIAKKGETLVLPEHLSAMIAKRFGSITPTRPKPVPDQYKPN